MYLDIFPIWKNCHNGLPLAFLVVSCFLVVFSILWYLSHPDKAVMGDIG